MANDTGARGMEPKRAHHLARRASSRCPNCGSSIVICSPKSAALEVAAALQRLAELELEGKVIFYDTEHFAEKLEQGTAISSSELKK